MIALLTNKHFIIALIVAPILAVIAYFAVDYSVSEKPRQAVPGTHYPLVAKSNCRYQSGQCTFENGDISIEVSTEVISAKVVNIHINSTIPVDGASIGFTYDTQTEEKESGDKASKPLQLSSSSADRREWLISLDSEIMDASAVRLVASINKSLYYGESTTQFFDYNTSFQQNNISQH